MHVSWTDGMNSLLPHAYSQTYLGHEARLHLSRINILTSLSYLLNSTSVTSLTTTAFTSGTAQLTAPASTAATVDMPLFGEFSSPLLPTPAGMHCPVNLSTVTLLMVLILIL